MHFDFHFTAGQIIFTLTFAAQLVLLVVLLGRDRARRFPWFTLGIVMMALRLMAIKLLAGRMPALTLNAIFIFMADAAAIVGFLVVVEMARRAFAPVKRNTWLAFTLIVLIVGAGILYAWGRPWPAWKTLTTDSLLANLRLLQLGAQRLDMLVDLLSVELGLLVILFGRRTGAGWRTHTQRLVIGLSTASAGQLSVEAIWQLIARHAVPHSQAEYDRVVALRDRLFNANGALYVVVLIWWIAVLWMDEPGTIANAEQSPAATPQPEYLSVGDEVPEQPHE
jgi:hypothetical protein